MKNIVKYGLKEDVIRSLNRMENILGLKMSEIKKALDDETSTSKNYSNCS